MLRLFVLPIAGAIPKYAQVKAQLRRQGQLLDDFDLLIGATALAHQLTLITNNTKHFAHFAGIRLEDWTSEIPPEIASLSLV